MDEFWFFSVKYINLTVLNLFYKVQFVGSMDSGSTFAKLFPSNW